MCIFLAMKKYAVIFLLRWPAGVWLATCLADQRPVALVWLTESEGSGPVGLAQLRLSAVDLSMWREVQLLHTQSDCFSSRKSRLYLPGWSFI